jgi:hypothetical protein
MATVVITIKTDNAAFEGRKYGNEVARHLRRVATDFDWTTRPDEKSDAWDIHDLDNGNTVGTVEVKD